MVAELHHQIVGLLVDGVSDIITVKSSDFQSPPDVASDIAKSFISGITSLEARLISKLNLDAVVPPTEARAA